MSLLNSLRTLVSKKKKRFEEDGYNLDLTYITDNIVAMGFPSSGTEALYRNSMSDTIEFFKERHGMGHFKVYNLCSERSYDHEKFGSFVEVFPFDDHNPPPLMLMRPFCNNVQQWLTTDSKNVAVIHCKVIIRKKKIQLIPIGWQRKDRNNDLCIFFT
jgi:phosphatidylinositol-3,4,5-trisphosphate 3-phosphatase/dual-specificity protein phosphatase PTEN